MKTIKYLVTTLFLTASFISCTDDSDDPIPIVEENPLAEYKMLKAVKANNHSIELYSEQEQFTIGYNELFIRIKDEASESYVSDANISWNPVMHMTEMMHSCPKSEVSKTENASVYKGFSIFQMPGNADEYWELNLEYTIAGQTYNATERIEVKAPADGKKRVSVFMGTDETRYVLAMMPIEPEVAVNEFSAVLFKMENMMTFPAVEDYKIMIDPRMPGMGNHGSPNNEDLTYDPASKMYNGKLSLTMTGYWKINLRLLNDADEVLKGEDVTEENESSSLFFEIEF
ncbi:hypothetical protein [Ulvibacterium marinum]|uniref:hypothetical protein n=1 Tax=Ulvibacterium marinum TaxID=2419782 RepID=UPI00249576F4|nr:hypothetical protein [Ulvibacterium marinum]